MKNKTIKHARSAHDRHNIMIAAGIVLGALFWIFESAAHVLIFGRDNLIQEIFRPQSHELWMRLIVVVMFVTFGVYAQFIITQRKRAEKIMAAEKERLAVTLRSIADGVIAADIQGNIILMNNVAEMLTGWTGKEALGKSLTEVFHVFDKKKSQLCKNLLDKVLTTGETVALVDHMTMAAKDGAEKIITGSSAPIYDKDGAIIGMVLAFRDITDQQKMEEELQKTSKIESIGVLAGGIAHDFNNILTAILGNIALAKLYAKSEDKILTRLTEVEKASLQAKNLTQQLLTFSKGGTPITSTASIAQLLEDSTTFALRGSNVRCEFSIPDNLWPVEIDEGQMNQVINNLVINAKQAMPEGGTMNVRVANITVGPERTRHGVPLQEGKYIEIAIEDHGTGIPEEHRHKIFDPYFTTKEKASGLGLATTYSIIEKHHGHIAVESEIGIGTTFYIYLPSSPREMLKMGVQDREKGLAAGEGKILIMDDEETVRDIAGKLLEHIGYQVEFARDGTETIELYRQAQEHDRPFDAVLMDLTVPGGMGGKEAIKTLIEIDPKVKAIVSSGYSNDPILANFRQYGFKGCIVKPYQIEELSTTLQSVLGESETVHETIESRKVASSSRQ